MSAFLAAGQTATYAVALCDRDRNIRRKLSSDFGTLAEARTHMRWLSRKYPNAKIVRTLSFTEMLSA